MIESPDLREAALDWLVRTNDPEFDGWDEFIAWLEASPANADAYHRLAASEAEMLPLVEATRSARGNAGQVFARSAYRASDGLPRPQAWPFSLPRRRPSSFRD